MAVNLTDIHPLSAFQSNPEEHIQQLKATGRPAVLTVDGQPEIVVQSADAYRRLIEDQELLESIRGLSYFAAQNSAAKLIVFIGPCARLVQE